MDEKRVYAADDILFESADITIKKGTVFAIEEVSEFGIILRSVEDDERIMIDLGTFEAGFEIAM